MYAALQPEGKRYRSGLFGISKQSRGRREQPDTRDIPAGHWEQHGVGASAKQPVNNRLSVVDRGFVFTAERPRVLTACFGLSTCSRFQVTLAQSEASDCSPIALNPRTCWMPVFFCFFFGQLHLSERDFFNLLRGLSDADSCIINVKFTYSPFCASADVSSHRGCVGDI